MKNSVKTLFAAMLVIFAASCQKDENQDKPGAGEPRTITATLANNDTQTKTHLDENLKTLWSEGDTIWISDGTNSAKIQLVKGTGEPKAGYIKGALASNEESFTFTVPSEITGTVYAVYPAFAQDGISSGKINIKIPTFQSGKFGDANISVAKGSGGTLQFKNATAVVKFVQATAKANDTVYLSANTQLAGKMGVTYGESLTVTANNPEMTGIAASFVDDTVSYVAVAAGKDSSIVVNVKKSNVSEYARKTVSPKQFEVNKVYRTSVDGLTSYKDTTYSGANSFIIPCGGTFNFDATYKGNSTTETVGTIDGVEVLWESFGTATTPTVGEIVSIVKREGNIVTIRATGNEGNAVIAVKNGSTILWSWHIWVCSGYDPEATKQEYNNSAGVMMDRNIGATSATKGSVKSLGLLYQWGRKDPFLGADTKYYFSNPKQAASTGTWESATSSTASTGTFAYAVEHPMQFITKNAQNDDWYHTGTSTTDNTRWQTSDTLKGLYDPCPAGWRVPDGGNSGVWCKAFNYTTSWKTSENWDGENKGMDFGKTNKKLVGTGSDQCWYPAAGYRNADVGSLYGVGDYGYYWSCTPLGSSACYLAFSSNGTVYPSLDFNRALGLSVRCLSE